MKNRQNGNGGGALSAFTITELIVAMVVLALVVSVTVPIVRKKMEKASYAQYWMGYNASVSIAKNLPQVNDSPTECEIEFAGKCWTILGTYTPMPFAECTGGSGTPTNPTPSVDEAKKLGIKNCYFENDYWAGAVKQCGGVTKMPTMEQLAQLAEQLYEGAEGIGAYEYKRNLTIKDQELWNTLISKSTDSSSFFYVWSNEENFGDSAYVRYFLATNSNYTRGTNNRKNSYLAVCLSEAPKPTGLCERIKDKFNTSDYDCTLANATDTSDFKNPHITFSNGLRLFIGSDFEELFPDAENENDRTGYKIYTDINGSKGKGILWEDVFPFYILKSGKVLAGYPNDAEIGGNNSEYLSVNIMYDDFSGASRTVKFLDFGADFKTAVCKAGIITSAAYCGDVSVDNICKTLESDCRIKVKTPIKIF